MWCCRDVFGLCVHICDVAWSSMYIHNLNLVFKCVGYVYGFVRTMNHVFCLCEFWVTVQVYKFFVTVL
jgi:hypothetical protein